ncbi:MAG: alpha/beta hydrolase [Pseudomonadota bacterium]
MAEIALMIHGTNGGGWTLENFSQAFRERGWQVLAPDLRYHDRDPTAEPHPELAGTGIQDYVDDLAALIEGMEAKPVLVGHSLGGVIAQKLAALGLARSIVLLNSSIVNGVLPSTAGERGVARAFMAAGPFWETTVYRDFDLLAEAALNTLDPETQRAICERLGHESGRVFFELFFWMFDEARTTWIDPETVTCPVLVVAGAEDKGVSPQTARKIAARYGERATYHEVPGACHYLMFDESWPETARFCLDWMERHWSETR